MSRRPRALALAACAALAGACDPLDNYGTDIVPGNSGVFTVATVGGVQKLYAPMPDPLPSGNAWVAVVDVAATGNGAAGAPAQLKAIDLGIPGSPSTVGANGTWAVVASGAGKHVWILDAVRDEVISTVVLDDTYGVAGFSGGGGYVTGVVVDGAHRRAILSVWDGFALMDLPSGEISRRFSAPPSENFGFDSARGLLLAPYYECTTSMLNGAPPAVCAEYPADGLNLIDLKSGKLWRYADPLAPVPASPVGGEPDAAAVDPTSGLAVVASELGPYEYVIDLTRAAYDEGTGTFTAPHQLVRDLAFTGIAIEPAGRLAFFEEEFSRHVAVMDLSAAAQGTGRATIGIVPDPPGAAVAWENIGDPHGVGAVAIGGKPMGLVVNRQRTWLARIDLEQMSTLPSSGGIIQPADLAAAMTFLDLRSPP